MRKNGKRDHALNKNGMSLTTMFTDDPGNHDLTLTIKDIHLTRIGSVKSPIMMGTGGTGNRMKIDGIDDIIIISLI